VLVDRALGEPHPDHVEDLHRLAEEEGRAVGVLPHDRRQQARLGEELPQREDREEQQQLPGPE
jgi:hypothetical protein